MTAPDDLDWLVHRYLLDELSAEEAAAFEDRLGTDEEAAAALSRGVMLLGTIQEAVQPSRPVEPAAPTDRRRLVAGLAAVAATIGLVCVLGISQTLRPAGSTSDAIELVSIWRESAGDGVVDTDALGTEDDAPVASDDVPDWLMAAVALDAPATDDEILEN